jgi:hypothetical protein
MNIIISGVAPRSAHWVDIARRHAAGGKLALISGAATGDRGSDICSYATLDEALRELRNGVAVLSQTAQVEQALAAGFDVVLDGAQAPREPGSLDTGQLSACWQLAKTRGRTIVLLREQRPGAVSGALAGLLGKVGPISHVSYIDRRPRAELGAAANGDKRYAQLTTFGIDHALTLQTLLNAEASSVIARCRADEAGVRSELFLTLGGNVHVQYYGSCASDASEQSVRVDGRAGALWSTGSAVWFRKRGWPKFVPWRWWPGHAPSTSDRFAQGAREALQLVASVAQGDAAARTRASRAFALLAASLASDQQSKVIDVRGLAA